MKDLKPPPSSKSGQKALDFHKGRTKIPLTCSTVIFRITLTISRTGGTIKLFTPSQLCANALMPDARGLKNLELKRLTLVFSRLANLSIENGPHLSDKMLKKRAVVSQSSTSIYFDNLSAITFSSRGIHLTVKSISCDFAR